MRKTVIWAAELIALLAVCVVAERIPWGEALGYVKAHTTEARVFAASSLAKILPGRWITVNGEVKGVEFTFTQSGRFSQFLSRQSGGECLVTGTYKIRPDKGRETVIMTMEKNEGCRTSVPPVTGEPADVVDDDHILFGEYTLERQK